MSIKEIADSMMEFLGFKKVGEETKEVKIIEEGVQEEEIPEGFNEISLEKAQVALEEGAIVYAIDVHGGEFFIDFSDWWLSEDSYKVQEEHNYLSTFTDFIYYITQEDYSACFSH